MHRRGASESNRRSVGGLGIFGQHLRCCWGTAMAQLTEARAAATALPTAALYSACTAAPCFLCFSVLTASSPSPVRGPRAEELGVEVLARYL